MRCRFGDFELDVAARQLRGGGGASIHLSRKAFDLLATLLAHRPNVVTKEELYKQLWPETFVTEANLMVLVGEVRRALGDNAHAPQFIRTAHSVGYAFCGEVRDTDAATPPAPATARARSWLVHERRTYPLSEGDNVIGRDPQCNVWLDDDSVSRRHAAIHVGKDAAPATLRDLQSTNGTFVGRRRATDAVRLSDGDAIRVGSVTLEFRSLGDEPRPTKRIGRRAGR